MRDVTKLAVLPVLALGLAGCDLLGSKEKVAEKKTVTTTKVASAASRLCGANATYTRLKQSAFDEAKRIRERDTDALDALAEASVVRMENPVLESSDEALGLTVCSGRMILELPPGASAAFEGQRRLAAEVTYSAQAAVDGSGTVFKIDGGEPIVYRLANFDAGGTRMASAEPLVADEAPEPPIVDETPVAQDVDVQEVEDSVFVPPPVPARPAFDVNQPSRAEREYARAVAQRRAQAQSQALARSQAQARSEAQARREAQATRVAAARAARAARIEAAESAAAVERRARAERVAVARRTQRGEPVVERRAARSASNRAAPVRTASASTERPSFNCRYARSRVEKLICGSDELASRDRQMASLYYRTNDVASAPTRRALSASRLRFLAYRDRCGNEACVAAAYQDRMDEIVDIGEE